MAVLSTRADQSTDVAHSLGDPYYGDRISLRVRRCVLLHLPSLALLDQSRYSSHPYGVRGNTRSKILGVSSLPSYFGTSSFFPRVNNDYYTQSESIGEFLEQVTVGLVRQVLTANATLADERKHMLEEEEIRSKHLLTLWEFEGVLKYSPFFYGWYTNQNSNRNYKLPLAYFVTNLVVYTYSFVAILRKYRLSPFVSPK